MNETSIIISNKTEFLKFLKSKFTLIHNSNIFFRDFHYGVMSYLQKEGKKMTYTEAEAVANEAAAELEKLGIFKKVDYQSWILNYPEFSLPKVEKVVEKKAS